MAEDWGEVARLAFRSLVGSRRPGVGRGARSLSDFAAWSDPPGSGPAERTLTAGPR
jgi:hypothetical protein